MDSLLYIILVILLFALILMIIKLFFMKKSIREIRGNLTEILKSDTNNLITVSTSNKEIRNLANDLNIELRTLREQKLQYENGNQELKNSLTNITHDMRTPLTAINGYIELIKNNKDKDEYLKIIEQKTNELILLTEQLFDFSKTMEFGVKMQKEECCINEILEESIANYYTIFKENNITPQIEISKNRIYRFVDKTTVIRVFENIFSNVVKYSDGDFKVILDENGQITFLNKALSLDKMTVEKIFNRYYTIENAKKSSGLGLSIAKQLVELNGGNISAEYIGNCLVIKINL